MNQIAVALHEASGQDITFQSELAYSLVGGVENRDKDSRVLC